MTIPQVQQLFDHVIQARRTSLYEGWRVPARGHVRGYSNFALIAVLQYFNFRIEATQIIRDIVNPTTDVNGTRYTLRIFCEGHLIFEAMDIRVTIKETHRRVRVLPGGGWLIKSGTLPSALECAVSV